ncbi:MAG TPA: class I SAM-dependent methyltransferase [Cytophagales bacterium]|nr:class I SAM-dependent methyltransferase [Cytophagales bacterium]
MSEFNPNTYWESRLTKIKGLEGVGYSRLGKQFNFWAYKVRKVAFLKALQENDIIVKGKNVLDIGSGTGFYVDIFRVLQAGNVTGMDITDQAVANLKTTFPQYEFLKMDIGEPLPEDSLLIQSFDVISCMDVLFHIVEDKRFEVAFENISKMLKPGGIFIYSDNFLNKETIRTKHQVSHSKKTLMDIFHKNGLQLFYHAPFMVLSNYPIDSNNVFLKGYWFILENTLAMVNMLGHAAGSLLYLVDKVLIKVVKDSPTSEIVVLRKEK